MLTLSYHYNCQLFAVQSTRWSISFLQIHMIGWQLYISNFQSRNWFAEIANQYLSPNIYACEKKEKEKRNISLILLLLIMWTRQDKV